MTDVDTPQKKTVLCCKQSRILKKSAKICPLTNAGWVVEFIKDKINLAGGNLPIKRQSAESDTLMDTKFF